MVSASPADERALRRPRGARHVLFVDADATVRDVTREALERMGATVRVAADAPSAVRLVEREAFDVLVIEWAQWSEPGRQLALFASQAQPGAGLVLVDGGGDATAPDHAVRIAKPFTPSVLASVID